MRLRALASMIVCASVAVAAQQNASVDKAFDAYWKADDAGSAAKAADRLIKDGIDFETAWAKLKAGRPYKKERTGEFSWRYSGPQGAVFDNIIEVPADYDPSRPAQVRVQLHGGVNRAAQRVGGVSLDEDEGGGSGAPAGNRGGPPSLGRRRAPNRIPGESQIYVLPSGWAEAAWWHTNQIDNILRLLDRLKRHYNVDESRVYFTGISDGGTGAYYMAMRETTPWASFLPLNGSVKVLANPDIKVDGELSFSNLANKPLYIVNGGRDPLYPVEHVQTHVDAMKQAGVSLVFSPQPSAGHDTTWWRWERTPYEQFVRTHPRQPHPPKVSWETERVDRFNRAHWLIIDRLGSGGSETAFKSVEIFPRRKPSGRVDVDRNGNTVQARTRGVREFTLLISPDAFDMSQPITVVVNDKQAFHDVVKQDVATLFKWAARDNDRTMLYGAEIKIQVP
jgi:dienelactone hydrolase